MDAEHLRMCRTLDRALHHACAARSYIAQLRDSGWLRREEAEIMLALIENIVLSLTDTYREQCIVE